MEYKLDELAKKSPSARKVWIEIVRNGAGNADRDVTFRKEGVD